MMITNDTNPGDIMVVEHGHLLCLETKTTQPRDPCE